ncbi:3-hydroxyacyl-CoA dehydrogenase/enoyl-CoA hydratase family protein [Halobellus limi]|uniref:enoyl-CoA hydratase n=1 Tax=Halobellus limi TaxID=699433 RepID=A0A1H5UNY2_9EURY|nr:3-hydroxyacyl-CoA dehydrogenase/enoyl-CoA hydratase family protein [Halobellus limi]QCC46976.1 3-hydroxyacyl-CoA dehydrogenase [Halobellus limi]SEF76724.1 3-hydroxyacyl-CoA dehydrogenase [Halobellus limi]
MDIDDVNAVAVLGAGSMGHGIAEVVALAGFEVRLRDVETEFVEDGYEQIEWSLGKLVEQGQIEEADADAALDRISTHVALAEAVQDVDVVIEAVPEQMAIKKDVYADLEAAAPDRTVFATNTSSLSVTELAGVTDRPERFCGMHFFNPPVRMDLVEVISGAETSEATLDLISALAERLGKTPVRVHKDSPGFIVNRVLAPLMNEAAWMVEAGDATIEEVDSTTKYGLGLPMGSFELADQVGIDVGYHVLEYMHEELGDAYRPCPLLESKVEDGKLGRKTGAGFYDYESGEGAQVPSDQVREDVADRLLAMLANEVAGLIENDVADAEAIDTAVKLGGRWSDGPAKMVDDADLEALLDVLDGRYEETGEERYAAVSYLRELAETGGGFHAGDGDGADGSSDSEGDAETYDYEDLSVEVRDRVGHVELDRAHRMNTITDGILEELRDVVERFEDDEAVRAILITGTGDRAFSAGADIQAMAGGAGDVNRAADLSRLGQETFGRLESSPLPVVAGIDGYCLGGGMELAMGADLRIASERSEFGQPEHDLGLLPGWGGTARLQRIVGMGRAKEIIFTADRYDAETMADYGFVNEVVANDEFDERAFEFARDLAAGPPIAQRYTKRAMHRGWDDVDAGLDVEAQSFGLLFDTEDLMEGMTAFMGDGEPEFEGK